jgi:hypothetical protein
MAVLRQNKITLNVNVLHIPIKSHRYTMGYKEEQIYSVQESNFKYNGRHVGSKNMEKRYHANMRRKLSGYINTTQSRAVSISKH